MVMWTYFLALVVLAITLWLTRGKKHSATERIQGETMAKVRPLADRVYVKRIAAKEVTAGGLYIPDTAQEKPQEGEIVSAGSGARTERGTITPLDVKAGDRVLFGKWSGTEVKIDGQDLLIMKESDIMGVLDAPAAKKKAA